MERIAPLAKILAEANGIDWRHLRGSGEGGLIVEADILAHLARIMSGEEEPPATPVDAPPPDWTGEDLSASLITPGLPSADALRGAGVDSDITAFVAQARTAPTPTAVTPAAPPLEDDALDFELDDDQADLLPPAAPAPAPAPAWNWNAPAPEPAAVAPQPFLPTAPEPALAPAAAASGAGLSVGLGGLLSRLYQPAAPAPAPQPQSEPVQPPVAQVPVLSEPLPTPAAPAFQPPAAPEFRLPEPPTPAPFPLPDLNAPAPLPVPEVEFERPAPLAAAPQVESPVEEFQPTPVQEQEAEEVAAQVPTEEVLGAEPAVPTVADLAPAPAPAREAVGFGTYLRRDANLGPAEGLRRQLVTALGVEVPLALLVTRAAQRHADALGAGTVALQDLKAGQALAVRPGTLREALAALDTPFEGTPDLLVTDAGELDLDDLHLGHTVTLSVGRVREGRAALTLNGDVNPVQAARFLADVAGTLEEPIILVI